MAKDYAKKKTNQTRKKREKKKKRGYKFLLSLLLASMFLLYMYIDSARLIAFKDSLTHNAPQKVEAKVKEVERKQQQQTTKPRFEFYTLLAGQQAIDVAEQSSPPSPADEPKSVVVSKEKNIKKKHVSKRPYLLQVASLRKYSDADRLKAQLLMEGFEVNVRAYKHAGLTWYRVQVGPYLSQKQAKLAQTQLRREHFDSILKRVA